MAIWISLNSFLYKYKGNDNISSNIDIRNVNDNIFDKFFEKYSSLGEMPDSLRVTPSLKPNPNTEHCW